ncbi:MAG: PEP-CTERM sorting domain-containing protein [Chthonomonadetes bacterium]|nr:PEP-CTERM sorting domain-containing protein [Chthonomonadetes bacterium]
MKRLMAVVLLAWATSLSVLAGDLEIGFYYGDIRSGTPGHIAPYQGYLRNVGTSDLYLNDWRYSTNPGEDWSQLGVYGYVAPIRLAPGEERQWQTILEVSINTNAVGIYSAELGVLGGADENARDELATLPFQVEVVDDYQFIVWIPNPDRVAGIGETVVYSHQYTNESTRDFRFTWLWTSVDGWPLELEHEFQQGSLIWEVPAGQTAETEVFSLKPLPGLPLGLYRGQSGVAGGYYWGDTQEIGANWTLTVVPEPSGLVALFGGITSLGVLMRFRRKR